MGGQSPRTRGSQIRVAARREKRRLARRGLIFRGFDLDEFLAKHSPVPNPAYRPAHIKKLRGRLVLVIPEKLNCYTTSDWETLAALLTKIRHESLKGNHRRVILNFHRVQSIAPEAAVALVAEIQRCRAFCDRRVTITGTYPKSADVSALLCDVGFFKALKVREPALPKSFKPRAYVQISRKNANIPSIADDLLECFEEVFDFHPDDRRRLYVALQESIDNVFEHAYPEGSTDPTFLKEWWLLGYADRHLGLISFTFYDQGAGIPATIRGRQPDRIRSTLAGWSDDRWIKRAIEKGVSRHKSKRRGHGLQKLREFISGLDVSGSLQVVANYGLATFTTTGGTIGTRLREELNGTLVVWQLRGIDVTVPKELSGDVPHAT